MRNIGRAPRAQRILAAAVVLVFAHIGNTQAQLERAQVGAWNISSHFNGGVFSHCTMLTRGAGEAGLIFSVARSSFMLGIFDAAWNLPVGGSIKGYYQIDDGPQMAVSGEIAARSLLAFRLQPDRTLYAQFRTAATVRVVVFYPLGHSLVFSIDGSAAAFDRLSACASAGMRMAAQPPATPDNQRTAPPQARSPERLSYDELPRYLRAAYADLLRRLLSWPVTQSGNPDRVGGANPYPHLAANKALAACIDWTASTPGSLHVKSYGYLGGQRTPEQASQGAEDWCRRIPTSVGCTCVVIDENDRNVLSFPASFIAMHFGQPTAPPQARPPERKEERKEGGSTATGFFVTREGHILTANHVVRDCKSLTVQVLGEVPLPASVVATSRSDDLALLKTNSRREVVAPFRSTSPRLGEAIVVYGFPLQGMLTSSGNLTTGNVAALAGLRDDHRMLQFSAPVQPGNSGGPLLDLRGAIAGVVVSKLDAIKAAQVTGDIPQNINFAVKTSVVLSFLEAHGIAVTRTDAQADLAVADVAERARAFTVRIECSAK